MHHSINISLPDNVADLPFLGTACQQISSIPPLSWLSTSYLAYCAKHGQLTFMATGLAKPTLLAWHSCLSPISPTIDSQTSISSTSTLPSALTSTLNLQEFLFNSSTTNFLILGHWLSTLRMTRPFDCLCDCFILRFYYISTMTSHL